MASLFTTGSDGSAGAEEGLEDGSKDFDDCWALLKLPIEAAVSVGSLVCSFSAEVVSDVRSEARMMSALLTCSNAEWNITSASGRFAGSFSMHLIINSLRAGS